MTRPHPSAGLERKLKTGEEKVEQLAKDKAQLEGDISNMMKSSGDSSEQLTKMNQDITQKQRLGRHCHNMDRYTEATVWSTLP